MAKIRFLDNVPIGVFATNPNGGGGGTTSGSFTGSFSGSFIGDLQGTASWAIYSLTSSYSNNINGENYYIPTFIGNNTLITSSIYQSGSYTSIRNSNSPNDPSNPDILYVSGDGVDTYNLISAHGNLDSYVQVNVQNYNSGSSASSDIVATADDGDETTGYIDMGINSSLYTASNFVGSAKDAYLYSTGNDLYIGNASVGQEVIIFNGGLDAANNARIVIHDQGTVGINTDQYNISNPPSLVVAAPNTSTNTLIKGEGAVDSFLQLAVSNTNTGTQASTDIVAYNDLDPSNQSFGFIDMGINSSNFNDPVNFPGWTSGDSYLYTDSSLLRIGSTATGSINFFIGSNPTSGSRFKLKDNNQHEITGSLNVSGSINAFSLTGSLLGTASYADNALSSSYALSASFAPSIPPFPFTGSARITGSLGVTGSVSIASGSLLIRSSSFNGIGLGDTLPTANLQINHPSNNTVNFLVQRNSNAIFDIANGGSSNSHRFRTYVLGGSVIGEIGTEDSGGIYSYIIQGYLQNTTNAQSAGIVFNTINSAFGGAPSFLFRNSSTANYDVYAGVVKPALIRLQGTQGAASGGGEYAAIRISNTINQTGGTGINYGIIYEPTLTSITGTHYGLVIRPSSTLNGIGHTTNLPTATWHVKGNSDTVGNAFRVENLSNTSYFNFANNGAITHNAASFTTFSDSSYIATFQDSYNGATGIRLSAAGNLHFFTGGPERVGKIGRKNDYDAGKLWYFAGANGGGLSGTAFHLFESDYGIATSANIYSQFLQLNPPGITETATAVSSFKFLDIKTSSSVNVNNPNHTIFGIDYTPTITSFNGRHFGILIRPSTLNGIGLGSTLPSSSLHIRGGLTGSVFQLESNTSASIFTITNAGSGSYTGSFSVLGGITGSLLGTASYAANALSSSFALTASYVANASSFPFTGSAIITGSLIVTGSVSLGDSTSPVIYTSIKTTVNSGSTVIYNVLTSSYDSAFFDYSLKGSSGARAGNIMAIWSGSNVSYTDNSTTDIGNTSDFIFGIILSGSNMVLIGSTSTNGWDLKTAIRTI